MQANKAAAVKAPQVKVTLVREPSAIDQILQRNALGYLTSDGNISVEDSVGYVLYKLESGQSAIREAILMCGWVFKTKTAEQSKKFEISLKARWSGSTLPNLISIARQIGKFEGEGLDLSKVKDLYGIRECAKLIKSDEHGKKAIAMLNSGESPRAVQKKLNPSDAPVKQEKTTSAPAPVNIGDESDKLETLILSYVDRYAKIGAVEARLKLTRQIIAKMAIGNYTFLPTGAAAAVAGLKAK